MKNRGTENIQWWDYHHDWQEDRGEVIGEIALTIYVNGTEFVSIMGTPLNQDWLAVGFLTNEGIISSLDDIADLRVTKDGCCIDIWLKQSVALPTRKIITSGCGGGLTYDDPRVRVEPFQTAVSSTPEVILQAYNFLQTKDSLYARARGVHAAGLLDLNSGRLVMIAEDIGRHNSIDKLRGACMLNAITTRDRALLTTGRISSEMLRKGAYMGCPLVVSRTSPTSLAVEMAKSWNVTLIGYARHGKLRVYCNPERLGYKI